MYVYIVVHTSCYSSRSSLVLYISSCSSLYHPVFRLPIKGLIGTSTVSNVNVALLVFIADFVYEVLNLFTIY